MDIEYVPEPKFVNLLKRLEDRRARQGSDANQSPGQSVKREPTPQEYEKYQIKLKTAAARRPELRATSPLNGFVRPASRNDDRDLNYDATNFTGPVINVNPLPMDSAVRAVSDSALHHNAALQLFNEREERIDQYLNREHSLDFFATTSEMEALRSQMQRPTDAPSAAPRPGSDTAAELPLNPSDALHSNLGRIELILGTGKAAKQDGPQLELETPANDAPVTPSTQPVSQPTDASSKMKKVINKVRIVRALDGGSSHHIEPQEIAALRQKLHDALQTIETMKVDHEREKAETALQTELRTMALKAEAEQRAEDLETVITALRGEINTLHHELETARKQADDLRPLQGEVTRLQAQVIKEQELRRAAEAETLKAQMELAKVPDLVAAGVRCAEAEKLGAEARYLAAIADSTKLNSELRAAQREAESLRNQLADVQDQLQVEKDSVAALEQKLLEAAAAYNELKCDMDVLEKDKANFEANAAARVEEELTALSAESQKRGETISRLTAEKQTLESEVARLQEIADLYETQRKTLKKMNRELTSVQEEVTQLRAGYANAMARRMHHIFTNIALKLHLARVLRPDGLADRLRQTEEQNKWLFDKLAHATAMAKRRLHPHKGPRTRHIVRLEGDEPDDHNHHVDDDGEKTPREGHWVWVIDSSTQTSTSAFDGGSTGHFHGNATMGSATAAAGNFIGIPSYVSMSASSQFGAASQAARVREIADTSHRLNPIADRSTSPSGTRNLYDAPLPLDTDLLTIDSNTYHHLPPRAGSAASTRSAGQKVNQNGNSMSAATLSSPAVAGPGIKRAASAGSVSSAARKQRPLSALSIASSSATTVLSPDPQFQPPPAPNLLVQGTTGPQGAVLSANPYNYFSLQQHLDERDRRSGSVASMGNSRQVNNNSSARLTDGHAVAPDWMPTSYATSSVKPALSRRDRPPSATEHLSSTNDSPQRSDDIAAGRQVAAVTELSSVMPSAHLPGGAWRSMRPGSR